MLLVERTRVTLTRGDTARLKLSIQDENGNDYIPDENDTIVMSVKRSLTDVTFVFQKTLSNDEFLILPVDTASLEPGTYYFDVQATVANGDVNTIIPPTELVIMRGVTE